MTIPDSGKLGAAVVSAVRDVAETYILPRYQKLAKGDVRSMTHPGDLVTVADVESEQALSKILSALLPGSEVIGEEAAAADAVVLDHLNGESPVWIIDPVDGTGNAAAGLPLAAFTGALSLDGVLTEALTYWLDGGSWWHARRGGPAAMRTTGRRTLDGALVSMIRPKADSRGFLAVAARADRTRVLGSSALEAAWVAAGVLDASLDAGSDTHRYVDVAAAVVLVEAAGGVVVDLHGRSLEFTTEITRRWSAVVAASGPLAEDVVRTVLEAQR